MCMSASPASFSNTHLYAGEAIKDGKIVHVLGYQNTASSSGPNAMILPIPTKEEMGPDNLVDTRSFKHFMKQIAEASRIKRLGRSLEETKGGNHDHDSLSYLFAPAMDAHDGLAPKVGAEVKVDHHVSFSTLDMKDGNPVRYSKLKHELLPKAVWGTKLTGPFHNGDFYTTRSMMKEGKYPSMFRTPPVKEAKREYLGLKGWE